LDRQPFRARSVVELDGLLAAYLTELFNTQRGGVSLAKHTFFALLAMAPHLHMRLHLSFRCLRAYIRLRPSVSWPPMPWPVALAAAAYLASIGRLREGVAVVVSAHCWLRVGEVVGLRRENFAASTDVRLGNVLPFSVLSVHDTKTRRFDSVEVTRRDVGALLRWIQAGQAERLFPFTISHLEGSLRDACAALGLTHCGYVWHSLRHGGATDACLAHMPFHDIMLRGRYVIGTAAGPEKNFQKSVPAVFVRSPHAVAFSIAHRSNDCCLESDGIDSHFGKLPLF
jgi:integrase